MEVSFKSSEELIGRVEETLKSFKPSGLLDTGQFYRWIKEILMRLNIPNYSPTTSLLKVNNYKITTPDDLHSVWAIWKCDKCGTSSTSKELQSTSVSPYFRTDQFYCKMDECDKPCKLYEENGELQVSRLYLDVPVEEKYKKTSLVKIKNYKSVSCETDSPSLKTKEPFEASISKNSISFNFNEGYVYLQYYGFEVDEEGLPLIPDQVYIESAIETHIIYSFFLEQYYNNTFDVAQRLGLADQKAKEALSNAISWRKLPTVVSSLDMIAKRNKKYKKFNYLHSRV